MDDPRRARPPDAASVLALFDEAVEWLVARGQTGQWGSEPFSAIEARIAAATEWAAGGGLRIAEHDGTVVGALVLGSHPEWVAPASEPERYIQALVSSRAHAGQDIGGALVRRAIEETRAAGVGAPARGLLGRGAAARRLVRAPGLRAQRHLRGPRLARPGVLATCLSRRGGAATAGRCGTPGTSWRSRR